MAVNSRLLSNRIQASLVLFGLLLVAPAIGSSQALGGLVGNKSANPAPTSPTDPLRRITPRDSIYAFLQACHDNKLDIAAQYLDLRHIRSDQRATQGPQLARDLCEILDRDSQFEVGRLNNQPEGNQLDGLPPAVDRLDTFDVNGQTVTMTLQRVPLGDLQVWVVSADSVSLIPRVAQLNSESEVEKKLPAIFVNVRFIGTPLYIWIELLIAALILSAISRILSRTFIAIIRPIARRFGKALHEHRLESFAEPLRLLLAVMIFSAVVTAIGPSALLRDYLYKLLTLLFIIGCASVGMRIIDVISDTVTSRLDPRERALSYSVLPLLVRAVKVVVFCIGVLSVLSAWGYNTNTILAGLGVGGLAVALASQKTVENLFGGVSVIFDRPVLVGDFCRFGDQVGTIEDIGLRSTRIRTLDRTVVTIPNSVFSTMTLENFAKRDRMWFHPTLPLSRDTTPDKIRPMMDAVAKILTEHPMIEIGGVPLRFTKISKESFDLEIFAYVLSSDFDEFLKVQSELLLKIVNAAQALDVKFAIPLQETLLGPATSVAVSHVPSDK